MAFDIIKATLVSIFVESVLYGFFTFIFLLVVSIIRKRHRNTPSTRSVNLKLLCVLVAMFLIATIHIVASFTRVLSAFVESIDAPVDGGPRPITRNLTAIDTPAYVLRIAVYCIQTSIGDAFILYRLYLVWNGNKLIISPLLVTFLGGLAAAIGALQSAARSHEVSDSNPLFNPKQGAWIISYIAMTVVTNATASILIAGRIWWVPKRITKMTNGTGYYNFGPASVAILESGAIYSCSLILLLIFYVRRSNAQVVIVDSITQIIGIVFSLVIVRVALGVSRGGAVRTQPTANAEQISGISVATGPTSSTRTWQSRRAQILKQSRPNDVIACQVEVVQSRDTDSISGEFAMTKLRSSDELANSNHSTDV